MSKIKTAIIIGAIGAATYFSGKYAYDYAAMNRADATFDEVAAEKTQVYGRIKEINELLPIVREDIKSQYLKEQTSLLEKAVSYDQKFLDAVKQKQDAQKKRHYSWAAFFL